MGHFRCAALAAVAVVGFASVASAADLPTKAPAAVVTDSGYYFWLDGMYDRVRLPSYQLGFHKGAPGAPYTDMGPVQSFDPSLSGGGVRGAFGYIMPGTSTKFEFGGSYVGAKANQSQSTTISINSLEAPLLGGGGTNNGFLCAGGFPCTTSGTLSTNYRAWQFNGKVSNDWRYGSVTVTPSLAVFGGNTRVNQTLSQSFTGSTIPSTGTYTANTTERWSDIGARIGIDINAPITTALTASIGGWVGGANRRTTLSGNDAATDTNGGTLAGSSTLSVGDTKAVLLANAEAGFVYKLTQMLALRGFAGLNYDGSVPGIAAPAWAGTIFPAPTSRTAASIYYAHETNYYAGGGVVVKW